MADQLPPRSEAPSSSIPVVVGASRIPATIPSQLPYSNDPEHQSYVIPILRGNGRPHQSLPPAANSSNRHHSNAAGPSTPTRVHSHRYAPATPTRETAAIPATRQSSGISTAMPPLLWPSRITPEQMSSSSPMGPDTPTPLSERLSNVQISSPLLYSTPLTCPSPTPVQLSPQEIREFRPMENISRRNEGRQKELFNLVLGFSPNYNGNPLLERNRSAPIPAEQNCSLFIIGLPAGIEVRELLGNIRDMGRIYAVHINNPEPVKGHFTCAAKVIFFERAAAERFFNQYHVGGFRIRNYAAKVVWNRIRTAEQGGPPHKSRVLIITGHESFVNREALTRYFESKLTFQVDEVVELATLRHRSVVEFRFGSYRCQAEAAKMALSREYGESVKVFFGQDPCA